MKVDADIFGAADLRPVLGRTFQAGDFYQEAPDVVVISRELWKSAFHSTATVVGHSIEVAGHPFVIIGVAPDSGKLAAGEVLWAPKPAI